MNCNFIVVETNDKIVCTNKGCCRTLNYKGKIPKANCRGIVRKANGKQGPGTILKKLLSKAGITPQRVKRLKYYLGLAPSCGCHVREDQLNRFGLWLRKLLTRKRRAT